jgi:serine protease Do
MKTSRRVAITLGLFSTVAVLLLLWCRQQPARGGRPFDFDLIGGKAMAKEQPVPSAAGLSRAFVSAADRVRPAVVHIDAEHKVAVAGPAANDPFDLFNDEFFRRFFRPGPGYRALPREQIQRGQGSGVIVDRRGYILTNNHVVGDADKIRVRLGDKREFEAKLVGRDRRSDVAVIKIEAEDLPVAATGDSDALRVGEWVLAIGNPFGLDQTVTAGVVSAKGRARVVDIQYQDFIQTDAAINPGNSGGPLVNLRGEVVGINTAIFSKSGGYMGIGFSIPVNMARKIMKSLIRHGKVVRGWLGVGIQDVDDDMAKTLGLPAAKGAMITEVVKDSPAAKAGLRERDVILSYDGKKVSGANSLTNAVGLTPVGREVKLDVYRRGKHTTVSVKIGERTAEIDTLAGGGHRLEKLGLSVEALTPENRRKYGLAENLTGVVITDVKTGGIAESAGLRVGMVIQQVGDVRVKSPADLRKAFAGGGKSVLIKVVSHGRPVYLALRMKKK